MKVTRIHHASVNASGTLEATFRFYRDVLGLEPVERPDIGFPGHWLAAGDGEVHLIDAPPAGAGIDPIGWHYCLAVDDLDEALRRFDEAGVPYFAIGEGDTRQVWVNDPSGATVELQQESRP
jgi:glyoxylase I family protein